VPYMDGRFREAGFWDERFERAPNIDGLKKVMEEVSRWLPQPADIEIVEDEKEKEDA
jgi:hypothetical protein